MKKLSLIVLVLFALCVNSFAGPPVPPAPSQGSVAITGGTITGITDLAIADGGTGQSTAIAALNALGIPSATAQNDFIVSGTTPFPWQKKTLAETQSILGLGSAAYTASSAYVTHSLATAANDFLVASESGTFVKKTLAETQAIIMPAPGPIGKTTPAPVYGSPVINKGPAAITSFAGTISTSGSSTTITFTSSADAILAGYNANNPIIGTTLITTAVNQASVTRYIQSWTNATQCVVDSVCTLAASSTLASVQAPVSVFVNSAGVVCGYMLASGVAYFVQNVGIGTTNPGQKLDVAGSINISAGSAYMYNGVNAIIASMGLSNWFFGDGGNLTATGNGNFSLGTNNLKSLTSGQNNNAQGAGALRAVSSGSGNTAFGQAALYAVTTGNYNTAIGYSALQNLTTNYSYNTALGFTAGRYYNGTTGDLTQVTNSTFIGAGASALNATGDTNEMVIGYNAIGLGSNTTVLGNSSTVTTAIYGNVGIGTTTFGTSAAKVLGMGLATPPTTTPSGVTQIFSSPTAGAGSATLGIFQEYAPYAGIAVASTTKIPVTVNGVLYFLLATTIQ